MEKPKRYYVASSPLDYKKLSSIMPLYSSNLVWVRPTGSECFELLDDSYVRKTILYKEWFWNKSHTVKDDVEFIPAWSLDELMYQLPQRLVENNGSVLYLAIMPFCDKWRISYGSVLYANDKNIIEAVVTTLCKLHEEGKL